MRERGTYYYDQNNGCVVVKISCDSDIIHCLGTDAGEHPPGESQDILHTILWMITAKCCLPSPRPRHLSAGVGRQAVNEPLQLSQCPEKVPTKASLLKVAYVSCRV